MKSQDIAIALSLARPAPPATYQALATSVGISVSECHNAVRRLRESGLVGDDRAVRKALLLDFAIHAARIAFPAVPGQLVTGVATGAAAFPDHEELPTPDLAPWVWPAAQGELRGQAIEPLHPRLPDAVVGDPWLRKALALVDLLRAGNTREVSWAKRMLTAMLGEGQPMARKDLSSPLALRGIFTRRNVLATLRKWLAEHTIEDVRGAHPLTRPILLTYQDEIADMVASTVPAAAWSPSPAYQLLGSKNDGGIRWWTYPSIVDIVVGRRLIDELEPWIRRDDAGRVFVARTRTSSSRPAGEYDEAGSEWRAFVSSAVDASLGFAVALRADVRDFFPSVDHGLARQVLAQRTAAHPRVIDLLFRCFRAWSPPGWPEGRGLPIEQHDISRLVAHALLKTVDDDFADAFDHRYRRFMDDTVLFVETRQDAEHGNVSYDRALGECGLSRNGQKTEILASHDYLARLGVAEQKRIDAAVGDERALCALWSEFVKREQEVGVRRALRRLYGLLLGRHEFLGDALRHLVVPEMRVAAGRYLGSLALDGPGLRRVLGTFDSLATVEARTDLADALAHAAVEDGEALAEWSAQALERSAEGEGALRSTLLLILFKQDRDHVRVRSYLRGLAPADLADALLRSTVAVVTRATSNAPPARWAAHGPLADEPWARRLLEDALAGQLPLPASRLIDACCPQAKVHPRLLPFLVVVGQGSADARRRLLEIGGRSRDPAVRRLLSFGDRS